MSIELHSNQIGGLLPEATVVLSSNFATPLYHTARAYKMRHPLGMYNISSGAVFSNFEIVLHEMENLVQTLPFHDLSLYKGSFALMEAQTNLLRSIDEHLEDCEKLLHAFFAPNLNFKGNQFVLEFLAAIQNYKDHVRTIVNHLKHDQGRVRGALVVHQWTDRVLVIPSYFVEGITDAGNPGPDPNIHTETSPAFSLFRDLRYHFCNIYLVSHYLAEAIIGVVGTQNITLPTSVNGTDERVTEIARAIAELPIAFLRHELSMEVPSVTINVMSDELCLSINFPGDDLPYWGEGARHFVLVDFRGDGVTKTFGLPFKPLVTT